MSDAKSVCSEAIIELQRAERYRIFLSLICVDLSFLKALGETESRSLYSKVEETARRMIRGCDSANVMDHGCLAVLYPETNRDGAEIGAKRISEAVRGHLEKISPRPLPEIIPLEIASYPDAAGAKTIDELLSVMQTRSDN